MGLEHGKLSASIGLPAPAQGLGPRGEPPIPTGNAKLQAHGPRSSRQLGGPRHKLAWSRDGGDPKSLAHSFYRRAAARLPAQVLYSHVPPRAASPLLPTCHPPEVPGYVPTTSAYPAREKKRGPVLGGGLERGGEGDNRHLPKKTVQIPRSFLARRRLLELTLTFTALRCLHLQRHCLSPTPASHRTQSCEQNQRVPPPLNQTLSVSIQLSQWLTRMLSSLTPQEQLPTRPQPPAESSKLTAQLQQR